MGYSSSFPAPQYRIRGCFHCIPSGITLRFTFRPMFDWPEQSHTSPTRTSLSVIVSLPALPVTCIARG
ncbi:MAG: hypothetical protein ACYSU0_23175, partial [Planctomycetota bacterium]